MLRMSTNLVHSLCEVGARRLALAEAHSMVPSQQECSAIASTPGQDAGAQLYIYSQRVPVERLVQPTTMLSTVNLHETIT